MFKSRLVLFTLLLMVVFIGLTVFAMTVISADELSLAYDFLIKTGHACGSGCSI